jgi:hypothetical protein
LTIEKCNFKTDASGWDNAASRSAREFISCRVGAVASHGVPSAGPPNHGGVHFLYRIAAGNLRDMLDARYGSKKQSFVI